MMMELVGDVGDWLSKIDPTLLWIDFDMPVLVWVWCQGVGDDGVSSSSATPSMLADPIFGIFPGGIFKSVSVIK